MKKVAATKPRNSEQTKANIIKAAQRIFAERGYAQAGMREIAQLADVSPALPVRYFGSKAGLFEAALVDAWDLETVLSLDKTNFGKQVVKSVLDKNTSITLPEMIALSIGDDEAAAIAGKFAEEQVIKPLGKWIGPPRAASRAYLILLICTGFVIYNRHILLDESNPARSGAIKWLEKALQDMVDGTEAEK
jgi:AcrR family transcriptional regulator